MLRCQRADRPVGVDLVEEEHLVVGADREMRRLARRVVLQQRLRARIDAPQGSLPPGSRAGAFGPAQ